MSSDGAVRSRTSVVSSMTPTGMISLAATAGGATVGVGGSTGTSGSSSSTDSSNKNSSSSTNGISDRSGMMKAEASPSPAPTAVAMESGVGVGALVLGSPPTSPDSSTITAPTSVRAAGSGAIGPFATTAVGLASASFTSAAAAAAAIPPSSNRKTVGINECGILQGADVGARSRIPFASSMTATGIMSLAAGADGVGVEAGTSTRTSIKTRDTNLGSTSNGTGKLDDTSETTAPSPVRRPTMLFEGKGAAATGEAFFGSNGSGGYGLSSDGSIIATTSDSANTSSAAATAPGDTGAGSRATAASASSATSYGFGARSGQGGATSSRGGKRTRRGVRDQLFSSREHDGASSCGEVHPRSQATAKRFRQKL